MNNDKIIYNVDGCDYLIVHRDAVDVDELIDIGHRLGVID